MITDRIDKTVKITEEYKNKILPAPESVKIELASVCNQKCKFCALKDNIKSKSMMDFELFKSIVDKCKEVGVKEIGLFYLGESTLYPRLVDAIRYCKSVGIEYVFLTTNGLEMSDRLIHDLVISGLDSIKFSLNYYSSKDFENVTGVPSNKIYNVIKSLINIKCERDYISLMNHLDKENHKYGTNLKIYASSIERESEEEQKQQEEFVKKIENIVDEHYWLPLYNQACYRHTHKYVGNMGRLDNLVPAIPCWGLLKKPNITFDGLMTLCPFDFNNDFVCGDLKTQSFMDCWNSEFAQNLREQHLTNNINNERCKKCLNLI